jgi:glycosyltransferase involved in cell wall biosynthesis
MKLFFFLVLLAAIFTGAFTGARYLNSRVALIDKAMPAQLTKPSGLTLKNLPFTIVIVGVNNGASLSKTLSSVFAQNYENYRVVYIDDASSDGSFDLARDLIYDSDHLGQVTFVHNTERLGVLANLVRALQVIPDEEIVVVLHGEDWLAHEWVLQRLNAYYADPDCWLTFGQYRDFPTYQLGVCRKIEELKYRSQPFAVSHLKTFYAGLFKKVRESDFISAGKFLSACSEMAYMIPMLEMAEDHSQFIPEVLYIKNSQAAYKEDREVQMRCEKFIRALDAYAPIHQLLEVEKCGA